MTPKISLTDIEFAIRKNCIIDKSCGKNLMLVKYQGTKNKSLGRILFLFFAGKAGHSRHAIQDYLAMDDSEYMTRSIKLMELLNGYELRNDLGKTDATDQFFHRKRMIIEASLFGIFSPKRT